MSRRRFAVSLGLALAAAGFAGGCSNPSTLLQPSEPSGPSGPSDQVVSVEIQGPEILAPGQSAQYTAIGHLSNGTSRALLLADWSSSDSSLLQITSSGVATAQSRIGDVLVSVRTTMSASKAVRVGHALSLSGDYTLTLESGSNCTLAAELRRRSYDARVTQNDARLEVVLTEPRFLPVDANARFYGTVTSTGATFLIESWSSGSDLMERLPDGSYLEIHGIAHTTESTGVLSGSLSGLFIHYGVPYGSCNASTFTLARR